MGKEKGEFDYIKFGSLLRETRQSSYKYKNMKKFSEDTGINENMLYRYEQGLHFPPIENFIKICKVLDKTPSYMLSSYLDIKSEDKELLEFFSKIKELKNDPEAWEIVQLMFLGLDIYSMEQRKDTVKDIINILKSIKNILSRKRS